MRIHILINAVFLLFGLFEYLAREADGLIALALFDDLRKTIKCATAYEEDILGIYLNKILIRMLSSTLRRNICNRTLENLEKRLLNALSGNISCYGAIFAFS